MGGRKSADTLENVMRACDDHALLTDQAIPGSRGRDWYYQQLRLLGLEPHQVKAWVVAEALRDYVMKQRPDMA
jgi:hypothetical protein